MSNKLLSAKVQKPVNVKLDGRIETLFDTLAVLQGDSRLSFFQNGQPRNPAERNYTQNPLPGDEIRKVLGVKVDTAIFAIKTAANIDPVKILNGLKKGSVEITVDSNSNKVVWVPITEFLDFDGAQITTGQTAADEYDIIVTIPSTGFRRLDDPFQIGVQQVFEVLVHFANAADFPTAAHWTTAGQMPLELRVELQVSKEDPKK